MGKIYEVCCLFMKMASGGVTYIRHFMTVCLSFQVIFSLLPQQSERLQCWYYWWGDQIYEVHLSNGLRRHGVHMTFCLSILVIFRLFPQQFDRLQFWDGFVKYASGGMINIPSFIRIGSDLQKLLWRDTHADTQTQRDSKVIS
jgi:hypothetical protein